MNKIDLIITNIYTNKQIALDVHFREHTKKLPVVLFVHGFKGFKDWGHFNLIAQEFVKNDFVFVKMNTSCNGTTASNLLDFVDLESFGQNNFSKELEDVDSVLNFIEDKIECYGGNPKEIYLIGHSRGGGIAVLTAQRNNKVKKLITWASVANFDYFFNSIDIAKWKSDGVVYTYNSRTQQNMPLYYNFYENYIENYSNLNVLKSASELDKNWLIIHGENDESVSVSAADELKNQNKNAILCVIKDANHTFGGKHPYIEKILPQTSTELINKSVEFLKL